MNIYQRIILIVGALVFVVVLLTVPKYLVPFEGGLKIKYSKSDLAAKKTHPTMEAHPTMDISAAAVRGAAVMGATILLCFAAGKKKDY